MIPKRLQIEPSTSARWVNPATSVVLDEGLHLRDLAEAGHPDEGDFIADSCLDCAQNHSTLSFPAREAPLKD